MKKAIACSALQCDKFSFTEENFDKAQSIISKYPEKRSAVLPLLHLVQEQNNNWIPIAAMDYIAKMVEVAAIRVYEVASFYSMFNTEPVGKYLIQVCRTTPCWLRGSDKVCDAVKKHLSIGVNCTTADGKFTLVEVECLGACVNAPLVQINDDYYEDLNDEKIINIISKLK